MPPTSVIPPLCWEEPNGKTLLSTFETIAYLMGFNSIRHRKWLEMLVSEAALHVMLLDKFRHPALASALFIDSLQFVYTPTPTLDS